MKTKDELLKIYSSYLPYELKVAHIDAQFENGYKIYLLNGISEKFRYKSEDLDEDDDKDLLNIKEIHFWLKDFGLNSTAHKIKPILYSMDYLTKDELHKYGFDNHVDWLTNERESIINKYGYEYFLNKIPYGHIRYLICRHYNVFGLSDSEFIKKETLKQ